MSKLIRNLYSLPWIGSYFGIEKPEGGKPFMEKRMLEIELHVLHRDLSVKTYQLRHSPEEFGCASEEIELVLRGLAYLDKDAVAHMRYEHEIDPLTGVRLKGYADKFPSVRKDHDKWKWHDNQNHSQEIRAMIEHEYIPGIYRAVLGGA